MIRFKDKVFEEYFIDPETAVITDRDGNVQHTYLHQGRFFFKKMHVHCIQVHTHLGYKKGYHIHHIDGDSQHNALANLVYMTPSEHHSLHNLGKSGWHHSKETREKMKALHKFGTCYSTEYKQKMSEAISKLQWWNNGFINKRTQECPGDGWVKGRLITEALRDKLSAHAKLINSHKYSKKGVS